MPVSPATNFLPQTSLLTTLLVTTFSLTTSLQNFLSLGSHTLGFQATVPKLGTTAGALLSSSRKRPRTHSRSSIYTPTRFPSTSTYILDQGTTMLATRKLLPTPTNHSHYEVRVRSNSTLKIRLLNSRTVHVQYLMT